MVSNSKISAMSVRQVAVTYAISFLGKFLADELALMDILEEEPKGEEMSVQHGHLFLLTQKIVADNDNSVTTNSKSGVVTTGVHHQKGESHLNLVQRYVNVFKFIILRSSSTALTAS